MNSKQHNPEPLSGDTTPWYRQFWPWFIIALPTAAVIASFYSPWLAVSRPDYLVVDEEQYRQINSELKAQSAAPDQKEAADKPDSAAKRDHD